MKNMVVALALVLGASSAMAHTQSATVCSVDRQGQISQIDILIQGEKATMMVDGYTLDYTVKTANAVSRLKAVSSVAGEKVVAATQYVLSAPQGTSTIQLATTASGGTLMIFPNDGILGASSADCR